MKKLFGLLSILLLSYSSWSQVPQSFSYQAVVRDASGNILQNQNVTFQFSILENSATGTPVYVETQPVTTNNLGLVVLAIGNGNVQQGIFSNIQWGNATHFLKVELDITGGSNYTEMGTTQLLSVPYALHAQTADNIQTFTAGNGISITGNVIENTAPNQIVNITGQGATTVSGTYPNYTISSTDNNTSYSAGTGIDLTGNTITNTAPDQAVSITGQGATTVTGTYPNFTISSTDNINDADTDPTNEIQTLNLVGNVLSISSGNTITLPTGTTYTAGSGIDLTSNTISNTAPDQTVTITGNGATTVSGTYPNFTISSTDNNTSYSAGTGISINGSNVINNTLPDQTVTISNGTGISVTGTYPDFTITNTSPNQTININGTGATTVSGTYPNFTINSTDNNTTYTAGTGITLTGTTFSHPTHTGDATGSTSLTVTGIQGRQVTSNAPANGQILKWNSTNSKWELGDDELGAAGTNDGVVTSIGVTGTTTKTITLTRSQSLPNLTATFTDEGSVYTAGTGINVTGTTITNTLPDQTVTINGSGSTTISGTYPNFTISSTDNNTTYSAGSGLTLTGTTFAHDAHSGDVSGTTSLTVTGIRGKTISSTAPTSGQVLKFNGTNWAPTSDDNTTYTAGTGISISTNTITNSAPDQTVILTGSGATSISGTYPNFTISSTDNNTTYSVGTGLNLIGTTFSAQNTTALWNANLLQGRTISSTAPASGQVLGWNGTNWAPATDANTTYSAGTGLTLTGTTFTHAAHSGDVSGTTSLTVTGIQGKTVSSTAPISNQVLQYNGTQWAPTQPSNLVSAGTGLSYSSNTLNSVWTQNGNNIYNNNTGRVGIGITAPTGKMTIQGDTSNILFEVRDKNGIPVFVVYQDSVQIFVANPSAKTNKGSFAVNAKNQSKAVITPFLRVAPDSTRIFTQDSLAGFGVKDRSTGTAKSYMQLTPKNYFVGHEAGKSITTTGFYNSFLGYMSGRSTTYGDDNVYLGYKSGYSNTTGSDGVFIGFNSGFSNTTGANNVFIGKNCGYSNTIGNSNCFIGEEAGYANVNGGYNAFIGYNSGHNNVNGLYNVYLGYYTGYFSNTGDNNILIGTRTGYFMDSANYNIMVGNYGGYYTDNGSYNTYIGYRSGYYNTSGEKNIFMGYTSGYKNTTGSSNSFIGNNSGYSNTTGEKNVFLGYYSGFNSTKASNNTFIGTESGYWDTTGYKNIFMGYRAGYSNRNGHQNVFIGDQAGYTNVSGNQIVCIGDSAGSKNTASNNIFIGSQAGRSNTSGNNNVFLGNIAGGGNTTGVGNTYIGWGTAIQNNGSNNVMIGYWAGLLATNSSNNLFIGQGAGVANTGNDNIFMGYVTGNGSYSNNIFIGNQLSTSADNTLIIEGGGDETNPLIYGNFSTNRVAFHRNSSNYPLQVGTSSSNGNAAFLTAGGTWTNTSSKLLKDRFVELNKNDLLNKIEQLDIESWFYKGTQEKHIGPVAEDFYQAFGTGVLDEPNYLGKSLAASDVAGVSLAAVKELIKEVKQLRTELDELKNTNNQLNNELNSIRKNNK